MSISLDDVQYYTRLLKGHLRLRQDYGAFQNGEKKLLIVEGGTDKEFVENIKNSNVKCISASEAFRANAVLRNQPDVTSQSCKKAIVNSVLGLSKYEKLLPAELQQNGRFDIYGLVDQDSDDLIDNENSANIFVTDTHDLETLIMYSDENVHQRIENCEISPSEVNTAKYMAYQLAQVRQAIIETRKKFVKDKQQEVAFLQKSKNDSAREWIQASSDEDINILERKPVRNSAQELMIKTLQESIEVFSKSLSTKAISCGSNDVAFSEFFSETKINIDKVLEYALSNSENSEKTKKIIECIKESNCIQNKFDGNGFWKLTETDFYKRIPQDFWQVVNGHDILAIIRYNNEDAKNEFKCWGGLNRKFEMALINSYDYSKFISTELYKKMNEEGIIEMAGD